MNKEWLAIGAMAAGGLCFAIGGTGFKWVRRYLMPCLLAGLAIWGGSIWWKCLCMALTMMIALCLPYGERTPYPVKFLVGCCFVAPTAFLGFTWWQIITPVAFILMFWASNAKATDRIFFWKAVEFITGALIGVTVSSFLVWG